MAPIAEMGLAGSRPSSQHRRYPAWREALSASSVSAPPDMLLTTPGAGAVACAWKAAQRYCEDLRCVDFIDEVHAEPGLGGYGTGDLLSLGAAPGCSSSRRTCAGSGYQASWSTIPT